MNLNFFKIDPMYEKNDFLRKAWISLAQEDAPLDIFESNFDEVARDDYHLLCTGANYDISWSGEIGNYRTESYLDVETYYDQEPYTDYVKKYNADTKTYYQEPVTKYRKVEKQRQVKKERRVTDWHSGSGQHSGQAKSWDCIDPKNTFDSHRYDKDVHSDDFVALTPLELKVSPDMFITEEMYARADELRRNDANQKLRFSLPGDEHRNINSRMISYNPTYASLFRFPEYSATIAYKGRHYVKRAFACGNMTMSSVSIANPVSVDVAKKNLHKERDNQIDTIQEQIKNTAWSKVFPIYLASIGVLALSCLVSLFIHSYFMVILCFAAAIGGSAFRKKYVKAAEKKATEELNKNIEELTAQYEKKINNYSEEHMAEVFKVLNKKLVSLGLPAATEAEFYKD